LKISCKGAKKSAIPQIYFAKKHSDPEIYFAEILSDPEIWNLQITELMQFSMIL
jgi:hypothetical protein